MFDVWPGYQTGNTQVTCSTCDQVIRREILRLHVRCVTRLSDGKYSGYMFVTCKQEESYVFRHNNFYFVYKQGKSAVNGIISLRYVLSGVKMIYLVYIFIYLYWTVGIFNLNKIQLRDKYVWVCVRSLCYKYFSCFNPLIYFGN